MTPEELAEIEKQCQECELEYEGDESYRNVTRAYGVRGIFIISAPNYIRKLISHIRDLEAQIEELKERMPKWVPAWEKLPKENEEVLFGVFDHSTQIFQGYIRNGMIFSDLFDEVKELRIGLYWTPLLGIPENIYKDLEDKETP